MEAKLENIKQMALKSRVIIVGSIFISLLIYIAVVLFHKPQVTLAPDQISVFESRREALEKQNEAVMKLSEEQARSSVFFAQRDSALQLEIKLNRKAIENIKLNHEDYSRFSTYSAGDWSRYFAALPDPGQ